MTLSGGSSSMCAHIQSDPEPGLHYRGDFRLAWESATGGGAAMVGTENVEILHKLISLQRSIIEKQDSGPDIHADLQLLDNKLNMALDLLGELFLSLNQLPARTPVDLAATTVAWHDLAPPKLDEVITLRLHLSDHYPRPLVLSARVTAVQVTDCGSQVLARFEDMDLPTRDELERLIFLLHRQQVAKAKRS